jgi:hypothetical protein
MIKKNSQDWYLADADEDVADHEADRVNRFAAVEHLSMADVVADQH